MADDLPPLDDCGFIRVPTPAGQPPLWMTCEQCGKSDHFWIVEDRVRCRCGATYDHAVRPDGATFGLDALTFVPFNDGPVQLADLEWDPARLALLAVFGVSVLAAVGVGIAWALGAFG